MIKKFFKYIVDYVKEEYKFLLFTILLLILLNIPLNYYIIIGGGISDAAERIEVEEKYQSNGSFNISYVTQLDANVLFYAISYLMPTWEREDANNYKYSEEESLEDIQFRSDLDLITASEEAKYWAYTLANKEVIEKSSKVYIIATYKEEYPTELKVGDEILSIDGNEYSNAQEYADYIHSKDIGEELEFKVLRDKKEQLIKTKLYNSNGKAIVGITLQLVKEYETDPKIEIKFKRSESGPSGGLITTLEIYNQLTKKDITNGKTIAGTGTIEPDGSIGQIGGIEYKVLGATAAKADVFLSPGGKNYEEAEKYIKEKNLKIKLIKVETIQEAIEKLEELK